MQHLESCSRVWVGKTPPLLMGRTEVVCNIWSHALEFGLVRPLLMGRRNLVCNIWSHVGKTLVNGKEKSCLQHLESCTRVCVCTTFPYANVQKKSRCQHLELCTGVWVGKTPPPPLLMGRKKSFATSEVKHMNLGG